MFFFWCDRLTFLSLCVLIFVLPATIGGVSIFSGTTILFFLIRKIAGSVQAVSQGRRWWSALRAKAPEPGLFIPLAVFVAINFLAVLWSQYPQQSQKAFIGKVLGHVLIYLAAQEAISSPRRLRIIINVFFVSAVLICIDALLQLWTGHDFFKRNQLIEGRVSAAFNHPNGLGAYLIFALPFMYTTCVLSWQRLPKVGRGIGKALFLTAGFFLAMVVMGLTYSRGVWLGLLVTAVFFLILSRRRSAVLFMAVSFLFLMVFVPLLRSYRHVSLVSEDASRLLPESLLKAITKGNDKVDGSSGGLLSEARPENHGKIETDGSPSQAEAKPKSNDWIDETYSKLVKVGLSGSERLIYWRDALKIIRDNPWRGTGLNTYSMVVKKYSVNQAYYPHNGYLQLTAELGIFGLCIFLWFLVVHLIHGAGMLRMMDPETKFLWSAVFAGFAGFLVHGFFDTTFYSVQHGALLWFYFGLLAASRSLTSRKEKACP